MSAPADQGVDGSRRGFASTWLVPEPPSAVCTNRAPNGLLCCCTAEGRSVGNAVPGRTDGLDAPVCAEAGARRWALVRAVVALALAAVVSGCSAAAPEPQPPPARTLDETALAQTFDGLGSTPFGSTGELTPDGRRVLDILGIQGALARLRAARSRYPADLAELAPAFVATVPRDPETGLGYAYRSIADGADYELSTRLSNGRTFSGVPLQAR